MLIKVCGMREPDNIRAVEQTGIDWMGFIFAPKSPRYVAEPPAYLPTRVKRVGVFVDADISEVRRHVSDYRLDFVQLHGHESPRYVRSLKGEAGIVKVFSVATAADLAPTEDYAGLADYFLFDTKAKLAGGNGTQFDWTVLAAYQGKTPYLLSGGIGPGDTPRLRTFFATVPGADRCVGIDLNSRFELSPALKNVNLLKRFLYEQDQ